MKIFLPAFLLFSLFSAAAYCQCTVKKPTNLTINSMTSCSATTSWSPSNNASYYQLRYKQGTGAWNYINTGTNTSTTVTGLLSGKNYSFSVAAFCSDNSTKGYSKQVKQKTLSCSSPTAIVVSGIAKHKATIQWQPVCGGTLFNLQYRKAGIIPWTTVSNISGNSTQLTGLVTGTTYEFQLQTNCGTTASAFTTIQQFTTTGAVPDVQPNILAVMVDDGRYDIYQPNGGPSWFETPAISRIANEGVNFKITCPVTSQCGPSRATFYTGLYSHKNGCVINGDDYDSSLPLIQEILKDHGYYTGFVGKYGQNFGQPEGFNWWAVSLSDDYTDQVYSINGVDTFIAGHISDIYPQLALEFLNKVPPGQPFVLFYFHRAPHGPAVPRPEDALLYTNDTMPFPSNFYKYDHDYPSFYYSSVHKWPYDSLETDSAKLLEYQTIAGVEDNVDTLTDWLEAHNQLDNTFMMYTSDNGFIRGEHLLQGKDLAQEESIRLPFFIRYPKWFAPGTVITDEIASNIDIAPTFLDVAGIPDTFGMDGVSLRMLANHTVSRKEFFYEFGGMFTVVAPIRAVRSLDYKYIYNFCNNITEEFYDLVNDSLENNNLINNPAYSTLIQTYRDKLDSMRIALEDIEPSIINCSLLHPTFEKATLEDDAQTGKGNNYFLLAPDPATQFFTIQLIKNEQADFRELTIMNMMGEPVFMRHQLSDADTNLKVDCSSWPAGTYLVVFQNDTTAVTQRMTVGH